MTHFIRNFSASLAITMGLFGCEGDPATVEPTHEKAASPQTSPSDSSSSAPARVAAAQMVFDASDEGASLVSLGIPSKATAAYYRSLPNDLLAARAKSGEVMAKAFLVERLAMDGLTLQRARKKNGRLPNNISDADLVADLGRISMELAPLLQDTNNAFAAYLWGMYMSAASYEGAYEPIVAGIRLAGLRGDPRASEIEQQFLTQHPGLDASLIENHFERGRRELIR
ncbi:MAG: hypothetical protein QM612_00220 [Thermomonas sp.]|uniref:hypothetical protein n=1 Tax=Thermomonas sp. TaxID=1971895 RepID=UPI0039E557A3